MAEINNTILIVDDTRLNVDMLTNILRHDYQIMAAMNGENALRLMENTHPDLVLLDIYMPGIDGYKVLEHMKECPNLASIPVIFISGEHSEKAEERGLELGAVDYVKKPYNASVVRAKVRNHLELKAYRDKLELLVAERTRELEEQKEQIEERTRLLEVRTRELAASHEAIIMGMSLMSESHDKVTGDHIERIKNFTKILSDKVSEMYPDILTRELADLIVLYSPLHDVGKVGIPDAILKKTGALTPEEFKIMEAHTTEGAKLLRKTENFLLRGKEGAQGLKVAIEIAECHHEKYNGKGYPRGMKGDEIPISARIVSIADVYDALRSSRPYKRAFTHIETMNILLWGDVRTTPDNFDPKLLKALSFVHEDFDKIFKI